MKPYQAQGLRIVGICVAIGAIFAVAVLLAINIRSEPQTVYVTSPAPTPAPSPQQVPAQTASSTALPPVPSLPPAGASQLTVPANETVEQADARAEAQRFLDDYFGTWSSDNQTALGFVQRGYLDTVSFYGRTVSRDEIEARKAEFATRWPERSYRPDMSTLAIACDETGSTCRVSGVVAFQARSLDRGSASAGTAAFQLQLARTPDGFRIAAENGQTLRRRAANSG